MGCRITKGVTEQCMARLRLTVITLFFPIHRKEYDFMEVQLVREQFQSDMIGKDNFRSVGIGKV